MNRRDFLKNASLTGLGVSLAPGLTFAADNKPDAPAAALGAPAVYAPTHEGATIVWSVPGDSVGWVEYCESGSENAPWKQAKADGFGFIPKDERVLRVRLRELSPGKTYSFRTKTRPAWRGAKPPADLHTVTGETYALRTLAPDVPTTRFCIWNDTHDVPRTLSRLSELTLTKEYDFLFWNGDVSNDINRESDIVPLYLNPRGGVDLAKGPPVLFVRGNHDARGPVANRLPAYIDYPTGHPYYSFRSGPVGAIVLDTGEAKPDDHPTLLGQGNFDALIREQAEWLTREIEKPHLRDAPYKVVFCHIPLRWRKEVTPNYDKGGYDEWSRRGREAWHTSLTKWGAQLVVSGHTHSPEFLKASPEFPYAQLVGGGPGRSKNGTGPDKPYLITAEAGPEKLVFRLIDLVDESVFREVAFKPTV